MPAPTEALLEKVRALPLNRQSEVEDFVDFLADRERDRGLVRTAADVSAASFARIWDNPEDDVYNDA